MPSMEADAASGRRSRPKPGMVLLEPVPSVCSGLRPLRPAGFIPARPYQSECAAGGRYGALETALEIGRAAGVGTMYRESRPANP